MLNSPYDRERVWEHLPENVQAKLIETQARFFVIDANKVARDCGMGGRINTIMQTCFFAISGRSATGAGNRRDQGIDSQDVCEERR